MVQNPYNYWLSCEARKGEYVWVYQKNAFNNLIIRETTSSIMINGYKFILLYNYPSHMQQWCDFNILFNHSMKYRIWRLLKSLYVPPHLNSVIVQVKLGHLIFKQRWACEYYFCSLDKQCQCTSLFFKIGMFVTIPRTRSYFLILGPSNRSVGLFLT